MKARTDDRGVLFVPSGEEAPASFKDAVTCGTCGRTWDDAHVTSVTPAPAARCPFEGWHTRPAFELIGHEGHFRLPGGRTVYEGVQYLMRSRTDRIRLARLATNRGHIHQINRWVDWDQPVEVLVDFDEGEEVYED